MRRMNQAHGSTYEKWDWRQRLVSWTWKEEDARLLQVIPSGGPSTLRLGRLVGDTA
jgi:hypothetical protein